MTTCCCCRPLRVSMLFVAFWLALGAGPLRAAEPILASSPRVTRADEKVTVAFAVTGPTDVEVAVLDAKGRIVRHLAAGVLGGQNPPPPPLKAGLAQRLEWDGMDDLAKPAAGGPFRLRVRAGMAVCYARMLGGSPYTGKVDGLARDGQGNLYVLMKAFIGHAMAGLHPLQVRMFDRTGEYVKTLLPYPAATDPAKATGFTLLAAGDATLTPANQASLYPVFYSFGGALYPRVVKGSLVFVAGPDWFSKRRRLSFFALDGSNALKTVPMWAGPVKPLSPFITAQVALSADGRTAYYSNVAGTKYDTKSPADIHPDWPQGRVYRQDLTAEGADPEPFFDLALPDWDKQKYWMPSAWDKKSAAAGIDVDAQGHVYVCDLVNQEVVEVGPDGKRLSATKVPWPDRVHVHPSTGELYVVSRKVSRGFPHPVTVYKIAGRGEKAKVVATLAFDKLHRDLGHYSALAVEGKATALYLAGGFWLKRIEDKGDRLVDAGGNLLNRDRNAIAFVNFMDVDPEADLVYVTAGGADNYPPKYATFGGVWRYHGPTGKGGRLKISAVDLAIGPRGRIYTWGTTGSYHGPVARYTRDLDPAPLKDSGKHTYGLLYSRFGRGNSVCGMDVDLRGRVFATYGGNLCHVRAYDADGQIVPFQRTATVKDRTKTETVPAAVTGIIGYGGSIRVDNAGNIYVLQQGTPKGFKRPAGFEKDPAYGQMVGTIYKFGPDGGEIHRAGWAVKEVVGALAAYPDCGPISKWRDMSSCACTKPRFDVDGFGRLYIPNAVTFKVSVRDNAGNQIVRFGAYGNFDDRGADGSPPISFGWPVGAGASDGHIYVGDCLNHRVTSVRKTWAAEEVVELK